MIHRDAGPRALGLVRIVVFGLWSLKVGAAPLQAFSRLPRALFDPPGIPGTLPPGTWDLLLAPPALMALQIGLTVLLILAAAGARPWTPLALLTVGGLLLFDGMVKGWGEWVNHAQFGMLYMAFILALFPAADGCSAFRNAAAPPRSRELYRTPLVVGALVLALAYSFIGIERVVRGGSDLYLSDALHLFMALRTFEPSAYSFEFGLRLAGVTGVASLLLRAGFFVTTIAEGLSPFALVWRRFRIGWLVVLVPFHVATLVTMNIFFWENLILMALLFTELPTRIEQRMGGVGRSDRDRPPMEPTGHLPHRSM